MEELNRSVHTWMEESEHSGANSDDGLSSPSAAGATPGSPAGNTWDHLLSSRRFPATRLLMRTHHATVHHTVYLV